MLELEHVDDQQLKRLQEIYDTLASKARGKQKLDGMKQRNGYMQSQTASTGQTKAQDAGIDGHKYMK